MNVTVTYPGGQPQTISAAMAAAVVAAALRAGHSVTIHRADAQTRWALTAPNRTVTNAAVNPDLFAIDTATPEWVERIAAAAADLI